MNSEFKNTKYEALGGVSFRRDEIRNPKYALAFSLTEVLLALGTLAVGMLFIAGVFPASIHLTTVASERTIAAVVADEAFAKIKLYNIEPSGLPFNAQFPLENVPLKNGGFLRDANEFAYPSTPASDPYSKRYWWSAICRKVSLDPQSRDVQVTIFVSRKVGITAGYAGYDTSRPGAAKVGVTGILGSYDLTITANKTFINDGYTIVDGSTGHIYRVLERYAGNDSVIKLDQPWPGGPGSVWVVTPPLQGSPLYPSGRYPCIAVYQKIIRF